jgi:hypothetical protein
LSRKKRLVSIPAEWRQGWQGSAFAPSENAVSAHGEQHLPRRAYLRIAGFMARLRQSTEQYCSRHTNGKSRREVNNDIDYVSRRGGAPDTAMAARPGRAVADRTVDALCNNPRLHSAADVERIAA